MKYIHFLCSSAFSPFPKSSSSLAVYATWANVIKRKPLVNTSHLKEENRLSVGELIAWPLTNMSAAALVWQSLGISHAVHFLQWAAVGSRWCCLPCGYSESMAKACKFSAAWASFCPHPHVQTSHSLGCRLRAGQHFFAGLASSNYESALYRMTQCPIQWSTLY